MRHAPYQQQAGSHMRVDFTGPLLLLLPANFQQHFLALLPLLP
jgi:hypothetical protein